MLRIIKRPGRETFYIRGTVRGQRIYESSGTSDRAQAEEFRAKREAELWAESLYGRKATVTFAHALTAYLEADDRSAPTKAFLLKLLKHFGTTKIREINQEALDKAYVAVLRDGTAAQPATKLRNVLTPLRAVLEFAAIRGWCDRPAFDRPRVKNTRTRFLTPDEATKLIESAAPHLKSLLIFLIATGARLSEALELSWENVDLLNGQASLWQKQGNERFAKLPPVAIQALVELNHRSGPVFRPPPRKTRLTVGYRYNGRIGGGQIKRAWSTACKKAKIEGATPHTLRHTYATWHYCMHRDLLLLKEDGGWQNVTMVARYAKMYPGGQADEIKAWLSHGGISDGKSAK